MRRRLTISFGYGISLLLMGNVVRVQPPERSVQMPICYWEATPGSSIDLSSLCGTQAKPRRSDGVVLPVSIQRYPATLQALVQKMIQANPKRFLTQAKTMCRILRYGGNQAAQVHLQALRQKQRDPIKLAQQQMVLDYAKSNYCPQFR